MREDVEMEPESCGMNSQIPNFESVESDFQMEAGDAFYDSDMWDQWAHGVDCHLQELSRCITNWESLIPPQIVIENRLETFEKQLAEKNAQAQAELLQFIHENLAKRNTEMCNQFEHQKQKSQEAIQQSVSQFIMQCQEGGNAVEKIADCQKQLLGIEVQRQVEGKFRDFEQKLREFLDGKFTRLEKSEKDVQDKLFAPGGLIEQVGNCSHSIEGVKSEFQREISAFRQGNRELCSGVNKRFAEIAAGQKAVIEESKTIFGTLTQEIQQRFEAVKSESKALGGRVTAIEKVLGSQEVTSEKSG
jgi:hypothetical protein